MSAPPVPPYGDQPGQSGPSAYPPPYQPPPPQPAYQPDPTFGPPQPGFGQPQPGYGQPQPGYGQPTPAPYGQPAAMPSYGQPLSAPPAYGQPGAYPTQAAYPGQPVYPGVPGLPPPPKKSSTGKIVLIVGAVLLVVCIGLGAIGAVVYNRLGYGDAAKTHLVVPDTLGGRPKITDPQLQSIMDSGIADLKKDLDNPGETVGALYGDPAAQDLLVVVAVQGVVSNPDAEISGAFSSIASSGDATTSNVETVDPGPLGGSAKCGDFTEDDVQLGLCAWADHGSVGAIFIYGKSADELKTNFATLRGQIEQRN